MDKLQENCLYFVKQDFFLTVNDNFLKQNKESTSRPHYFPFVDALTGLCWLIPCSSQIEKYQNIIASKEAQHKPHNHIQIIKVSGKKEAFLYQDMFPIAAHYIEKPYSNQYGIFEITDPRVIEKIRDNAKKIIKLLRHGVKFTPTQPDINRIEKYMLDELAEKQEITPPALLLDIKKPSIHDRLESAKAQAAAQAAPTQPPHKSGPER